MNKDTVRGKVKQVAGRVQSKVGKLTGSRKIRVKGALLQAEGTVQHTWGKVKDSARSARARVQQGRRKRAAGMNKGAARAKATSRHG
jgi:uncharacterized protein YjbJ (UPF0337 family)